MNNRVLKISIALNVFLLITAAGMTWKFGVMGKIVDRLSPNLKMERVLHVEKKNMSAYLREICVKKPKNVFLGDSITRGASLYFPGYLEGNDMVFAGIDGDSSSGVLARLDEIFALEPKKVFLMIGINDLRSGRASGEVLSFCSRIMDRFVGTKIQLFVQSVFPLGAGDFASGMNPEIVKFNRALKKTAMEKGCVYVDVASALTVAGYLSDRYTDDELHLNFEGYKVWADQIKHLLD